MQPIPGAAGDPAVRVKPHPWHRKPDPVAAEIGAEAVALRMRAGIGAVELAKAHQWPVKTWFDAEEGIAGLEKSRACLHLTRLYVIPRLPPEESP